MTGTNDLDRQHVAALYLDDLSSKQRAIPHANRWVQRALTDDELDAILAGITAATSIRTLIPSLAHAVYNMLLADLGSSVEQFDAGHRLWPDDFAIPSWQWWTLLGAVTVRAASWDHVPAVLDAANCLPATYDPDADTGPAGGAPSKRSWWARHRSDRASSRLRQSPGRRR